jgi:hypothetical protein
MGMRVGAAVVGMVGDAIISGAQVRGQPLGAQSDALLHGREMDAGTALAILACAFDADGLRCAGHDALVVVYAGLDVHVGEVLGSLVVAQALPPMWLMAQPSSHLIVAVLVRLGKGAYAEAAGSPSIQDL